MLIAFRVLWILLLIIQRFESRRGGCSPINFRSKFCWLIFAFFSILSHQACALRLASATNIPSNANVSFQTILQEEYVVLSGNTTQQSQQLMASLRSILDDENIAEYGGPYTGPQFWLVQMNSAQFSRLLKSIPGVSTMRNW